MFQISKRVESLSPSQTLAMSQKSAELRSQGVDVINLSVGEPDFPTPQFIKAAAKKAIDDNFSHYTPVAGYYSLREAICQKLHRENGVDFTPEQIVVSNGAKQALCNVILSTINPGDEVVIPVPAWVSYFEMVKLAEGTVVPISADINTDFKISANQLREVLNPRTRMVLLCSPSNPSGSVYSHQELVEIVEVLKNFPNALVVSDEIYEHILYTGSFTSLASFPEIASRTIIINGVSKAYAMTGWRIGYCAAPLPIAKAVTKLQGQYTSGASSIAQKAAEAAYTGPQECVAEMREAFLRRRNLIVGLANAIPGMRCNMPEGAFYIFPEVTSFIGKTTPAGVRIESSGDLAMYLLEVGHVATVDGSAFFMPGYIRISYATSDENIRLAMQRIKKALLVLN